MYFGYRTGVHEADELTDGHLASVASVLLTQPTLEFRRAPGPSALGELAELKAHDYQQSMSIVIWDRAGNILSHSGEAPAPAFSLNDGFETLALGTPPRRWRAFSRWNGSDHARKVTVMLSVSERDDLADDIAEQIASPGLWLLPVVALVLIFAVRRGLQPLLELSHQVNLLDVHRNTTLSAPPHEEFRAIVQSIDMLVSRYNAALARERELASEVAHELRTPLASLRLHAASLRYGLPPEQLAEALRRIELDAGRAAAVLTDVLALARASRTELADAEQQLDLAQLARGVAAEYGQTAMESGHELAVEAPETCDMSGHPVLIELALRNLIENALAHTPRGSTVQVIVQADPLALEVRDNGAAMDKSPDVPERRLHLGLGLGHQVVRRVAEVHDGRFEALDLPVGGERAYRIIFRAAAA